MGVPRGSCDCCDKLNNHLFRLDFEEFYICPACMPLPHKHDDGSEITGE